MGEELEIRKTIRLSIDELETVEKVRRELGLADFSKALCHIIRQHGILQEELKKLQENYDKAMTRIRLASNGADVNSQVLLEAVNALCWELQAKDFRSTETAVHPIIEEARQTVKERIARFKQAKDSKTYK